MVEVLLGLTYGNNANKRYEVMSQNFRFISDAVMGPIEEYAEHE